MIRLSHFFLKLSTSLFLFILIFACKPSANKQKQSIDIQDEKVGEDLNERKELAVRTNSKTSKAKPQKLISRDTIKIEKDNYKNKILLSKEMLFDYCNPASKLPCYIDADKFLAYIDKGVGHVYNKALIENGIFTEEELVNNLLGLKDYIKEGLALNNELQLICPSSRKREKIRNMLTDMNHSIYYIFRWQYFADRLRAGEIQIYSNSLKQSVAEIYREEVHKDGRKIIAYYLDVAKERYYSDNLEL